MKNSITISKRCLAGLAGVLLFCGQNIEAAARQGLSQLLRVGRGLQPGISGVQQPQMQRIGIESGLMPSRLPRLTISEESSMVAEPSQPSTSAPEFMQSEDIRQALREARPLRQPAYTLQEPTELSESVPPSQMSQPTTSRQEPEQLVDVEGVRAWRQERLEEMREQYKRLEDDLASLKKVLPELEKAAQGPFGFWFPESKKAAAEQNLVNVKEKIASLENALIQHKAEQAKLEQSLQNVEADVAQRNAYIAALPQKMQKELQGQIDALTKRIVNNINYVSGLSARDRSNILQDYYDRYNKEYTDLWMHYKETDPVTTGYFIDAWQSINGTDQINRIKEIVSGKLPLAEIQKPFEKPVVTDDAWYKKLIPGNLVQKKFGSGDSQQRRQFSTVVPSVPLPSPAITRPLFQEPETILPSRVEEFVEPAIVEKKPREKKKRPDTYVTRVQEGALAPFIPVGIRNVIHREKFKELSAAGIPKGERRKAVRAVDYDAISRGLLEKMVSGEKPTFIPPQAGQMPRSAPTRAPRQAADIAPLSSGAEQALVPVVAGASTALVPVRGQKPEAFEIVEPIAAPEQGTLTVVANKPVTDAFIADAQSGEVVPGFIVQYKPGLQGQAGELVIASQDQQIQLDLNVFNADRLQPQLRQMLAQLVRRNEPVTLAVYPEQGRLMLTDVSAQSSQALVPLSAGAQAGQPDIISQLVDVLSNEETVVLRFETQQAAQPALPEPSEQEARQPMQPPQRAEPSQPREQARPHIPDSPAETSEPQRTYEQQRVVERKEVQPKITREERPAKRRPDLSQQAEKIRRQRSATQAVEAAGQRAEAQRQAEQLEQLREREAVESLQAERPSEGEELMISQAGQITPQETQVTQQSSGAQEGYMSTEELAEQAERDRMEQFRLRQEEREAFDALSRQEGADRAQAAMREDRQEVLRRNAEQQELQGTAPEESRVVEGPPVIESAPTVQAQPVVESALGVAVEPSIVHIQIPTQADVRPTPVVPTGTSPVLGAPAVQSLEILRDIQQQPVIEPVPGIAVEPSTVQIQTPTPADVRPTPVVPTGTLPTNIQSAPAVPAVQMPTGTSTNISVSTGGDSSQAAIGTPSSAGIVVDVPTGLPGESTQDLSGRNLEQNRAIQALLQTPLSRHRAAILAAMRQNAPIPRNIVDDFDTYSINIRDMLLVYNRQVLHCKAVRAWNNQAKTEADAVLAKIKTNIKQMLDRRGLTVDAQS